MLQVVPTKRSTYLSARLLLTAILFIAPACGLNTSSNFARESKGLEPEIVSVRNPNIIIQQPAAESLVTLGSLVTFSWLPESIEAYDDAGLKDSPIQETIQETITKSLNRNGYVYHESTVPGETQFGRKERRKHIQPKDIILVKSWKWAGVNFGGGGFLKEITLDNKSNQHVKDLKIRIDYLGTKTKKEGTRGPTSTFVIKGLIPAKSEKTFKDINVGFRHPHAREESIRVLSVKPMIRDLLIGYTLVTENTLNNQDINTRYSVTADPSGISNRKSEYEKGTVIIDVLDAETSVLVWRGAVQALANFDVSKATELNRIKLAVEKLVASFIMSNQ